MPSILGHCPRWPCHQRGLHQGTAPPSDLVLADGLPRWQRTWTGSTGLLGPPRLGTAFPTGNEPFPACGDTHRRCSHAHRIPVPPSQPSSLGLHAVSHLVPWPVGRLHLRGNGRGLPGTFFKGPVRLRLAAHLRVPDSPVRKNSSIGCCSPWEPRSLWIGIPACLVFSAPRAVEMDPVLRDRSKERPEPYLDSAGSFPFASCPQAPWTSRPRLRRTVTKQPRAFSHSANCCTRSSPGWRKALAACSFMG